MPAIDYLYILLASRYNLMMLEWDESSYPLQAEELQETPLGHFLNITNELV